MGPNVLIYLIGLKKKHYVMVFMKGEIL